MHRKSLPSRARLQELLSYDAATGTLTHKVASARRKAGAVVCVQEPPRYTTVNLDGKNYLAHRVIWKYVTGEEPLIVDHINGNKADNRFANLRAVTAQQNAWNRSRRQATSLAEMTGVIQAHGKTVWRAYIKTSNGPIYIGPFKTAAEAQAARDQLIPLYRGDFHRSA